MNNSLEVKRSRNRTTSGETGMHSFSKKYTVKFLNEGGRIHSQCQKCLCISMSPLNIKYDDEVTGKGIRWDVAGFDEKKEVKYGIEVMHTSRVNKIKERLDFKWIEVWADDILSEAKDFNSKIWKLKSLQPCNNCRDEIKLIFSFKENNSKGSTV